MMNILPFLHFFAFLVYCCLIVFILWKDPKSWLNRSCAAFFACLALWSFTYIFVQNLNSSEDTAILFDNIGSIGWVSFASFFLWFSLVFTEKKKILKAKIIYPLIFILPLLFIYKQWTGFFSSDYIKRPWGWEAIGASSMWWYYYLYYLSFIIISLYLILNFRRKTKEPIKKKQVRIIFVATLIPLILATITDAILPELNIVMIPTMGNIITLIWAFGIVYAIVKYKLMVVTPAAAAENIISTMADSLILSDRQGNITSVNKAALDLSGYRKDELTGKSIEIFFREKDFKSTLLGKAIRGEIIRNYEFSFKTKTGNNIPVIFSSSTIMDEAGSIAGIVCIVKDITERKLAEDELQQSYQKTKRAIDATIETMSKMVEVKDPYYTAGHQQRVSQLAIAIAKELNLSQDKVEGIRRASLIHDIGKIGLPSELLSKPTKLNDIEFSLIKSHSQIGYDILKTIDFSYPVAEIVLQHQERINGSGYPQGLKGGKILLGARIIGVADVVEAMASHRPYRPALGIDAALEEISKNKGILYDSEIVDACLKLFKEKGFKFE